MEGLFPFQLPPATALYLVLYLVTLGLHFLAMHYVFAGTAWVAWSSLAGRRGAEAGRAGPLVEVLRDWLPFALGAAITAGVAPLLFVQVLYPQSFYTANLLLFHRWMVLLPVLIAGFYLLYVLKSRAWRSGGRLGRLVVGAGPFLLFLFVAWSWAENHLLGLEGQEQWAAFYASDAIFHTSGEVPLRVGVWLAAAFPGMAAVLALQLRGPAAKAPRPGTVRTLASVALAGLVAFVVLAAGWRLALDEGARTRLGASGTAPFLYVGAAGVLLQAGAWTAVRRSGVLAGRLLALAWLGLLLSTFGWLCVREGMRVAALDREALAALHARAAEAGGLPVFLLFFAGNAFLVALVLRTGWRARPAEAST